MKSVIHTLLPVCVVALLATTQSAAQTFSDQGATVLGGINHNSRSASFGDIDNDGDLDMMFQGASGSQQLYRNNLIGTGTMNYTNISGDLPSGLGPSWSAAWGDYNGDGNVDIFVGQSNIGATGDVLRNDGVSGFSNQSNATGLDDPGFHQNVAWADINNDNRLDLIIGMEGPEKHEIYLQNAGGTFDPVGASVGFQIDDGTAYAGQKAYGMAIGDSDGDGDLDIYISTCIGIANNIRNIFYENQLAQTGTLSFIDITDTNGTQFTPNSYGTEFFDFDDDGDLDLYMTGADGEASKIFRNDGGNQFTDVDTITGHALLSDTAGDLNGAKAVDYDNDGDLDLFFHDHRTRSGNNQARKLYRNDGNWEFTDVTVAEGLDETNKGSYDSPWADIDRDGDMDLIGTTDSGSDERAFMSNASTNGNHWLFVELDGTSDNTTGLGASIYATINEGTAQERTLRREANTNAGTFNQSDLPVHFGLGDATLIDTLRIVWPDGNVQQLFDVSIDQYLNVVYNIGLPGDIDGDGFVGINDLNIILGNWNKTVLLGSDIHGDIAGNGDGFVGIDDLNEVLGNWNAGTPPSATASVPEPGTAVLLGVTASALLRRRG